MTDPTRQPLWGRRVLVTRSALQSDRLADLLRARGADAVEVAMVALEGTTSAPKLAAAFAEWRVAATEPAWVAFTSTNAVRLVVAALEMARGGPEALNDGLLVAAVGAETLAALDGAGVHVDIVPNSFDAAALATAMVERGCSGGSVWLPQSAAARPGLADTLRAAGAAVVVVPIYRPALPSDAMSALGEVMAEGPLDVVTFMSSSAAQNFRRALAGIRFPAGAIAACLGRATAETAEALGFPVEVVADATTSAGLVEALVRHFASASGEG